MLKKEIDLLRLNTGADMYKMLDELSFDFMENLKRGDSFELSGNKVEVIKEGKYKSKYKHIYRTITISHKDRNIKFYRMPYFGYTGNPNSINRKSSMHQDNFIRDVEGVLLVDLLNKDNPLHDQSQIMQIITKNKA